MKEFIGLFLVLCLVRSKFWVLGLKNLEGEGEYYTKVTST